MLLGGLEVLGIGCAAFISYFVGEYVSILYKINSIFIIKLNSF